MVCDFLGFCDLGGGLLFCGLLVCCLCVFVFAVVILCLVGLDCVLVAF